MSTSVSSSPKAKKSNRSRSRPTRTLFLVGGVLVGALFAIVIAIRGRVSGVEFAPSHFQTRSFSFYEIPFVHWAITPITRKVSTEPVARQIRTKSWITTPRGKAPSDWHIASISRGPSTTPGDASLLTSTLELRSGGKAFWKQWNLDHPRSAAVLWPIVQKLAKRELYVIIPELLLLARTLPGGDDPATLRSAITDWLPDQYVGLIRDQRAAKNQQFAADLLAEALDDYPDSEALRTLQSSK